MTTSFSRTGFVSTLLPALFLPVLPMSWPGIWPPEILADTPPDHDGDDRATAAGNWQITRVDMNGKQVSPEITDLLSITYAANGSWILLFKTIPLGEGTSTIDPSTQPKSFVMHTPGSANRKRPGRAYLGIYEGVEETRRICFTMPGRPRPTEFSSTREGGEILVAMKRKPPREQKHF